MEDDLLYFMRAIANTKVNSSDEFENDTDQILKGHNSDIFYKRDFLMF